MKIDKVFIINLEHRKDRRQQIRKELKRVKIDNFEFFNAVKPTEEMVKMWNPQFLNPIPQWFALSGGDHTKYRIGALGCMLSHMEIIKKCIEDKYENVLILEDDTMFDIRDGIKFHQIWDTLANQINNLDFGLLYLAGNHRGAILEKKTDLLKKIISRCCEIKADVVSRDERESDLRAILNYGHTFAHAVEALSGYHSITHGFAVALGMRAAARLAVLMNMLGPEEEKRQSDLLDAYGLPRTFSVDREKAWNIMALDKKVDRGNRIYILPNCIGKVSRVVNIEKRLVFEAWNAISEKSLKT